MLQKIKSNFILGKIFLNIIERRKLTLVAYNKNIQLNLGIKIIDFRRLSERYIIFEGKGKGEEYDSYGNNLIYKGTFVNGKRFNGNGKEYDKYFKKLIFEGEYLNGQRWEGWFTKYDKEGNKKFNCRYSKGKLDGEGQEYLANKLIFDGHYLNGKRNGFGTEYDGYIYHLFKGQYCNGKRNGKGTEYNYKGCIIFEGNYSNGLRNGFGKEYNVNSELVFEGEYLNGHKKKGKYYIDDYLEFEGEYLFDKKWNGKGFDKDGKIEYELVNGNGKVKEYYFGEIGLVLIYEGEYLDGKKNGKAKEYNTFGRLIFEGEFLNGEKWNGKEIRYLDSFSFETEYINGEIKL